LPANRSGFPRETVAKSQAEDDATLREASDNSQAEANKTPDDNSNTSDSSESSSEAQPLFSIFGVDILSYYADKKTEQRAGVPSTYTQAANRSDIQHPENKNIESTDTSSYETQQRNSQNDSDSGSRRDTDRTCTTSTDFDTLLEHPPEVAHSGEVPTVGEDLEELLQHRIKKADPDYIYNTNPGSGTLGREKIPERLQQPLRDLAEQKTTNIDGPSAIETGDWTDDDIAAAFLSSDPHVAPPLTQRLLAWLLPERTLGKTVDRTVKEIHEQYTTRSEEK